MRNAYKCWCWNILRAVRGLMTTMHFNIFVYIYIYFPSFFYLCYYNKCKLIDLVCITVMTAILRIVVFRLTSKQGKATAHSKLTKWWRKCLFWRWEWLRFWVIVIPAVSYHFWDDFFSSKCRHNYGEKILANWGCPCIYTKLFEFSMTQWFPTFQI